MSSSLLLRFAPPVIHYKLLPDAMVHRKISNDMKERAIYLLMEAGWEMESIAEALGVSARSIERWEENYITHGWANPPRSFMRHPKLLTADTIENIQEFARILLDVIKEWLALYHDQPISTTALYMNLQDLALTHERLKRWRLNATNPAKMIAWCCVGMAAPLVDKTLSTMSLSIVEFDTVSSLLFCSVVTWLRGS